PVVIAFTESSWTDIAALPWKSWRHRYACVWSCPSWGVPQLGFSLASEFAAGTGRWATDAASQQEAAKIGAHELPPPPAAPSASRVGEIPMGLDNVTAGSNPPDEI